MGKVLKVLAGEPVAVVTAVLAIVQVVAGILAHNVTESVITAAVTAVLGLFARSRVSPVSDTPPLTPPGGSVP